MPQIAIPVPSCVQKKMYAMIFKAVNLRKDGFHLDAHSFALV